MKTKTFIIGLLSLFITGSVFAANTVFVTSNADSGEGTLRQLVEDAEPGDSIIIPADYTIVLESSISFAKDLKINGQGATVKVTEPGVSNWSVFGIADATSTREPYLVTLNNLKLEGGDVVNNASPLCYGGVIFVERNIDFKLMNSTLTGGKATYGGGLWINNASGSNTYIENCIFKNNETQKSTTGNTGNGGGAGLKGNAIVKDCLFENNKSAAGGSGVISYNQAKISNCIFIGNESSGTYGGAVSNNNTAAGNTTDLDNCSFISNVSTGANSAGALVLVNNINHSSTLTNCTFYNNTGTVAGAVWNRVGYLKAINCTFAGNLATTANGAALSYLHKTNPSGANHSRFAETILINNIFAYNYNASGMMDIAVYDGFNETTADEGTGVTGQNNIAVNTNGSLISLTNPVAFTYGEEPEEDSPLFAEYITNGDGQKIPEVDDKTKTIALSVNSVAIKAGIASYGDPELVPGKDQIGKTRNNPPAIGAREYESGSTTHITNTNNNDLVTYRNPAKGTLYINSKTDIYKVNIMDMSGRVVYSEMKPTTAIPLSSVPYGLYMVSFETPEGNVSGKLIVK